VSNVETTARRCPGDCNVTHDSIDWGGFAASVIAHHGLDSKENDDAAMVVFDEAGARALLTELGLADRVDGWIVALGMQSAVVSASATFDRIMAESTAAPIAEPGEEAVVAWGAVLEAAGRCGPMAPAPDGLLEVEPHPSHPQWVGIGDAGGALMCGSCGKDLDDDEAALPCSVVQVPPAISALFDAWAKRTGAIFVDATRMTSRLDIVADLLRGIVWEMTPRLSAAPESEKPIGVAYHAVASALDEHGYVGIAAAMRGRHSIDSSIRMTTRAILSALVTLFAAGRASRDEEVAALRTESDRLEALFQQTHGCHSSWVAEGSRLRADVRRLTAEREEARDWVRRMQAENVTTCIHCGTAFPPGTPTHGADALREHARVCEKHPMRAVETEVAALRERLAMAETRHANAIEVDATHEQMRGLAQRVTDLEIEEAEVGKLIADLRARDRGAGVGHTKQCRTKHGRITCDCGWADLAARLEAAS